MPELTLADVRLLLEWWTLIQQKQLESTRDQPVVDKLQALEAELWEKKRRASY